jgi:hypothetical protein
MLRLPLLGARDTELRLDHLTHDLPALGMPFDSTARARLRPREQLVHPRRSHAEDPT